MKEILQQVTVEDLSILGLLDENARGSVPLANRIKREQVGKDIYEAYTTLMKASSLVLDKTSSLEHVLAVYLLGAGQFVSEPLFYFYTHFARMFRNCFRDCAQEIYDFCFKETDTVCRTINVHECKLSPIICDFFLRFYVPYENKDPDFKAAIELICFDMCKWMYDRKISIVEVTMKQSGITLRRNLICPKAKKSNPDPKV